MSRPTEGHGGHGTAVRALAHRWPTCFGIGFAVLTLSGEFSGGTEYATLLFLLSAGYLFVAVVGRKTIIWPAMLGLVAVVVAMRLAHQDPWPVLAAAVITLVAVDLVTGRLRGPGLAGLQSPGALGFTALGVVALSVPADVGTYLVAAGLLGHAAWDAVHWRADRFISRSFTEWCFVFDILLGLGILAFAVLR